MPSIMDMTDLFLGHETSIRGFVGSSMRVATLSGATVSGSSGC